MVRALKWIPVIALPAQPRRWVAFALLALAAGAARIAARLQQEARAPRVREFAAIEVDGRRVGALYEDGRLVALLPVQRL